MTFAKLPLTATAALFVFTLPAASRAATVAFDFTNATNAAALEVLDGSNTLSYTLTSGLTSLTATFTSTGGVLNNTASGGLAVGTDSDLDSGESITITFDKPVTFDQITLSGYTGSPTNDLATLTLPSGAIDLAPLAPGIDVYSFTNQPISIGQSATLSFKSGNGFNFFGFVVSTTDTAAVVPLPGALLGGLTLLSGLGLSRRRTTTA